MKSSALALFTAAAMLIGAPAAFAQDAAATATDSTAATTTVAPATGTPAEALTPEECAALQGAGATPPGESLVDSTAADDSDATSDGNDTGVGSMAMDEENNRPEVCPPLGDTEDQ